MGVLLVGGLFVLGITQTVVNYTNTPTGAALVEAQEPPQIDQRELNLCMNGCMRKCVAQPGDEPACNDVCDEECGVWHAG